MNKLASFLQSHLHGEVVTSDNAREFFSTDASVLSIKPTMAAYPRTTNDVRKIARFAWQLAEKGHKLPITARGGGSDLSGAAIGPGIVTVFTAHMNNILEIDTKHRKVRVQPGVNFKSLQETLYTHGLFLPPYPASYEYSSIGGAIANNSGGEKSVKYGTIRNWVDRLEVVLSNGEVIQTGRLSRREVNKKQGTATLEGEIYRGVDALCQEYATQIAQAEASITTSKNSVGYVLTDVRHRDGSIDLTPLFIGSQGTLGLVVEAILNVAPYSPHTELVVASFNSPAEAITASQQLLGLEPSALEMVDQHLLNYVIEQGKTPLHILGTEADDVPAIVLFAEFDNVKDSDRKKRAKKAEKFLSSTASRVIRTKDPNQQDDLWSIRHSAAAIVNYNHGTASSLPIIEDGIVPSERFEEYLDKVYELFKQYKLDIAIWGHAGDANLHMQPILDLQRLGHRQTVFKLMDDYYRMVLSLGGSIAAEHNDGRLRAPYVALQVGGDMLDAYQKLRTIFDPKTILNPGVKTGTTLKDLAGQLRGHYDLAHMSQHLPRT